MSFTQILLTPFVWLLLFFYNLFSSYGLALILFALVVKCILFPFSLKGKKSMIQMTMVSGKMQQIQKKYATDKERQNLEIQKLYEKEKINPMGGCMWSMLPVLVLFPLYAIIREPLTYLMTLAGEQITQIAIALDWDTVAIAMNWMKPDAVQKALDVAKEAGTALTSYTNAGYNQLFLSSLITPDSLQTAQQAVGGAGANLFPINFDFLGINLAQVPNWKFWVDGITWNKIGLFLIPIVSALSGLMFSFISMKTNAVNNQAAQAQNNSTNKMMLIMMPLMSLWIGFAMPAGLGIYWIANNFFSMAQEFISGKLLKKDYEAAARAREEQERLEKEEEKNKKRQAAERKAAALEEAKKNKKQKVVIEKKTSDTAAITASRVGIRSYARGRAYEPNRFRPDGPTDYREPGKAIDENVVEKALEKKANKLEKAAFEAEADDMIIEELMEAKDATTEAVIPEEVGQADGEDTVETEADTVKEDKDE